MTRAARAERGAEAALALVALATALHLWSRFDNPVGLRVQTLLSTTAWRAAEGLERLPGFEDVSDLLVLVRGTLLAVVVIALLRPGRRGGVRAWAGHAAAIVPLFGLGAVVLYGGGMAPIAWGATLVGALLVGRHPAEGPPPFAVVAAGAWAGCVAFLLLHALYVSGPGIQPALVADGGIGAWFQSVLEPLTGAPFLRRLVQATLAAALVLLSGALHRRGVPILPRLRRGPAGWLAPVAHAALLAGVTALPVQVLWSWKCPAADPAVTEIDARAGSFQLHVVDEGRALWSVDREAAVTRRWALPEGTPLPDVDWRTIRYEAWPEEQIPSRGAVWGALVDPELHDSSVLVRLDAATGRPLGDPVVTDGCYVASWASLPDGRLLLGCEYTPEFIVLRAADGTILDRFEVPEAGSFEEVVVQGDVAYTVPLWFGARLTRVDLSERRALGSSLLGDFNWGAEAADGRLFVTRFHEGRLLSVDMATGAVLDAVRVGYGARPVVVRPGGRWVIAAGTYSGALAAAEVRPDGTFGDVRRRLVGGLVRSLAPAADGRSLYYAGRCGVQALDLDAWLGADR